YRPSLSNYDLLTMITKQMRGTGIGRRIPLPQRVCVLAIPRFPSGESGRPAAPALLTWLSTLDYAEPLRSVQVRDQAFQSSPPSFPCLLVLLVLEEVAGIASKGVADSVDRFEVNGLGLARDHAPDDPLSHACLFGQPICRSALL